MSVSAKMTAIADQIRTLSGTTGAMGLDAMATNVSDANAEIETQTELLEQIMTALEGKAVSGGESNGSSDVSVATCTVVLYIPYYEGTIAPISAFSCYTGSTSDSPFVTGKSLDNADEYELEAAFVDDITYSKYTINNVLCNTPFVICDVYSQGIFATNEFYITSGEASPDFAESGFYKFTTGTNPDDVIVISFDTQIENMDSSMTG